MLTQAEIDAITHLLDAKFVPEQKSKTADMYWLVDGGIRISVERINSTATITTTTYGEDGLGSIINIFRKSKHYIPDNGGIVRCVQDHIAQLKVVLVDTGKVAQRLSEKRRYDAIQRQQELVIAQTKQLIKAPGYIKAQNNCIHIMFPTKGILQSQHESLGSVVCDLHRSDSEIVEALTKIIQVSNDKYVQHLINERNRINEELSIYGVTQ